MKKLMLLLLLVTTSFSLTNKEVEYIKEQMEIFELEWDNTLEQEYKNNIILNGYKGSFFDLGWTASAVTFIESRGVKNRANANVSRYNVQSFDCGMMGSNTYYYLKYKGYNNISLYEQIEACHTLNHNPNKSFLHFLNVIEDAMDNRFIKRLKGTGRYWHYIWNYYNTGSATKLKGKYYLKIIAAIRVLKKKIKIEEDVLKIGLTTKDMKPIILQISRWNERR